MQAAIKARRFYRLSESAQLIIAAAIPVSAVVASDNVTVPAILGSVVVVFNGLRSIFHWHDDYIRFSGAREAVEGERRLYLSGSSPYDDPTTRDQLLAAAVTNIERQEMDTWIKIAAKRPESKEGA